MIDNKFIIIVPVYNGSEYIEKCLVSILKQTYKNYKLIVVDDCSTDSTLNIVHDIMIKSNFSFRYIKNDKRIGSPLANFIKGLRLLSNDDNDILITVDGDDWLYNDNVLNYLNEIYQNEDVYMTHGSFIPLSGNYGKYGAMIPDFRSYRKENTWLASHLRTFKRKVWNLLKDDDLRDNDGEYYRTAGDAAILYPILEMCGTKHARFINDILYVYNDLNPTNEMKICQEEQLRVLNIIKNKPQYNEI